MYELKIIHLILFIQTRRVKTMFALFNILNQNFYYYTLLWPRIEIAYVYNYEYDT